MAFPTITIMNPIKAVQSRMKKRRSLRERWEQFSKKTCSSSRTWTEDDLSSNVTESFLDLTRSSDRKQESKLVRFDLSCNEIQRVSEEDTDQSSSRGRRVRFNFASTTFHEDPRGPVDEELLLATWHPRSDLARFHRETIMEVKRLSMDTNVQCIMKMLYEASCFSIPSEEHREPSPFALCRQFLPDLYQEYEHLVGLEKYLMLPRSLGHNEARRRAILQTTTYRIRSIVGDAYYQECQRISHPSYMLALEMARTTGFLVNSDNAPRD